ncbi:MAG: RraA family protein [Thermomicrobiales bacterium]|jgi:regulator of RNase E activity RraA|nr:RraA family protein [Thermomicrobiales bacterium]MDF2758388.1 RraA family protein [Thermomicrobiales bacterium]MDF3015481.1 RraA family protein [Thermomicrobiales bacterium]
MTDLSNVPPISEKDVAFLRSVDSPTISNAIEPFKVRDRTEGFIGGEVRSLFPEMPPMVGAALTVAMNNSPGAVAERENYWRMYEALSQMPAPSVLVAQDVSGAPSRCALAGEVMTTMAMRLGAVGMVTDGGLRDVHEVRRLGFAYFARYIVVSHGNFGVVEVGEPVTLDGQEVKTGDILHGDANGIVIVPREVLQGLPEAVQEVRTRERATMDFVNSPEYTIAAARKRAGY